MAQVSKGLLARLQQQRRKFEPSGILIDNKNLTRLRFRILPCSTEGLGAQYISFYSKDLKRGTSSPASWDLDCPVEDYINHLNLTLSSSAARERIERAVQRVSEHWLPVIDRAEEGSPGAPNVRILRAKKSVYAQVVAWFCGEDDDQGSDDLTHPTEGRDLIVKKTGSGLETKWTLDKCDRSSISADSEMSKAWLRLAKDFDVRSKFFPVDADVLAQMYSALTDGDDIPERYLEGISKVVKGGEYFSSIVKPQDDDDVEEMAPAPERVVVAASSDLTGKRVTFDDSGTEIHGEVAGPDTDDDADGKDMWLVRADDDDSGSHYSIPRSLLTIVETYSEEVEVAQEAPPAPKKKAVAEAPASKPEMPRKPEKASSAIKDRMRRK